MPMKRKCQANYVDLSKSKHNRVTHKLTNDIFKTFIDLTQYDINKIKIKKVRNPKSNIANGKSEGINILPNEGT